MDSHEIRPQRPLDGEPSMPLDSLSLVPVIGILRVHTFSCVLASPWSLWWGASFRSVALLGPTDIKINCLQGVLKGLLRGYRDILFIRIKSLSVGMQTTHHDPYYCHLGKRIEKANSLLPRRVCTLNCPVSMPGLQWESSLTHLWILFLLCQRCFQKASSSEPLYPNASSLYSLGHSKLRWESNI